METAILDEKKEYNQKLFPYYKMFSWDLLFFYSIEFLFYTTTKKITASEVLIVSGIFMVFKIITQIPAVAIIEYLGKRKSLILNIEYIKSISLSDSANIYIVFNVNCNILYVF